MFQPPEYCKTLSLKLSEVLEDVGVNENMVMNRRRTCLLRDALTTITFRLSGLKRTVYGLGSSFEGTTTIGLHSDMDSLSVDYDINVIQDWPEWKRNKINLFMIQDEGVTPGYCFLQLVRSDAPRFETNIPDENYIRHNNGRILLRNTVRTTFRQRNTERHGPSNAISGSDRYCDHDVVFAFPCYSMPQSTSQFLERPGVQRWLSSESISYDCFVVGASSKIAAYPELEWRISTSLAERNLFCKLNITQLQCYTLMKIFVKTFLNPKNENNLSSYMCKTVFFHCIEKTEQKIWERENLCTCLSHCLLELHSYVQNENCPHFIISENNLMAGQFTVEEEKQDVLQKLRVVEQSEDRCLQQISIDNISQRLQVKLSPNVHFAYSFPTPLEIHEECSSQMSIALMNKVNRCLLGFFIHIPKDHLISNLKQIISKLTYCSEQGNRYEKLASCYLAPFLCSTLGLIMVSSSIDENYQHLNEALKWLNLGLSSDVTSGRLKYASMFYCVGDMDNAELILRQTEGRYNSSVVEPVCGCWRYPWTSRSKEFARKCSENHIDIITSCCVKFLPKEVNCVPQELRYEMLRSTRDDIPHRDPTDWLWMDYAVVDSLTYIYFLQYKTYGHLKRQQDQKRALSNLVKVIFTGRNLCHRETALNLLGQCMEQEDKPREAFQCYKFSLQQRKRHNAAKFHICNLLRKYVSNMPSKHMTLYQRVQFP